MNTALHDLGLKPFFTRQLTHKETQTSHLARVIQVQRTHVLVSDGEEEWAITLGGGWYQLPAQQRPTVGDWVVLDDDREKVMRLLERKSVFQRLAAGSDVDIQLIAANVDTVFIVTSCNDDFNESRLERYLSLALEAGVAPVVVLSKADVAEDASSYLERVKALHPDLPTVLVSALQADTLPTLFHWLTDNATVALIGSSGVGKSTLLNMLAGKQIMETASIREQDAKGRHTTSFRSLHRVPSGGLLVDVPGIRELNVKPEDSAPADLFTDIEDLASQCKFRNCEHSKEPKMRRANRHSVWAT